MVSGPATEPRRSLILATGATGATPCADSVIIIVIIVIIATPKAASHVPKAAYASLWYLGFPTQCFTPCPGAMYHLSLVLPGQQGNLFQESRGNQVTFPAILCFLPKGVNHLRTLADWETALTSSGTWPARQWELIRTS